MKCLIQPEPGKEETYLALAENEKLGFEILVYPYPKTAEAALYRSFQPALSVHGAFIDVNPASGDPEQRRLSRSRMEESCRFAEALGAKRVVFHGSCFPFLRGPYLRKWTELSAEFYRELLEKHALDIYVENSLDLDPEPSALLLEAVGQARLHACLDIGHAHYSRASLKTWFEMLRPWLGYLHLSDNQGQFDDHLALGEGSVDWEEVDFLASGLPADTPATLEVGDPEGIRRSLTFLQGHRYLGL